MSSRAAAPPTTERIWGAKRGALALVCRPIRFHISEQSREVGVEPGSRAPGFLGSRQESPQETMGSFDNADGSWQHGTQADVASEIPMAKQVKFAQLSTVAGASGFPGQQTGN